MSRVGTATTLLSLCMLASVVAACASEESKAMKKVAGTYALTSRDTMAAMVLAGTKMTLREDGRWVSVSAPDTFFHRPAGSDSGTYRVRGDKVAIRSSEGVLAYVARGDTLLVDKAEAARRVAMAEAVTGVKSTGQAETFYVRVQ